MSAECLTTGLDTGLLFRHLRESMRVSLRDIERGSGVARTFLSEWENGAAGNEQFERWAWKALSLTTLETIRAGAKVLEMVGKKLVG